ncbi:MAG: hypothetical protein AAF202_07350 [Pseudomonadota bacterium]
MNALPENLLYAELGSCLPTHLSTVLEASYVAPDKANCFNSALHFFDNRPVEFLDEHSFAEEIAENFDPLPENSETQYGDLGVVYENGIPFHAFVVISGNWGFTKNGTEPFKRHRFQRISSIASRYFANDLRYFRKKQSN